jgi:hypothetical protein
MQAGSLSNGGRMVTVTRNIIKTVLYTLIAKKSDCQYLCILTQPMR